MTKSLTGKCIVLIGLVVILAACGGGGGGGGSTGGGTTTGGTTTGGTTTGGTTTGGTTTGGTTTGGTTTGGTTTGGTTTGGDTTTGSSVVAVASVTVLPETKKIVQNSTLQLTAVSQDAGGNTLMGLTVTWASSDISVARVDTNGLVTGVTPGPATISATVGGKTDTLALTIVPPIEAMLTAGSSHSCGLTTMGEAYCWGSNGWGQLGNGTRFDSSSPVAVAGGHTFSAMSAGYAHTCALTPAGTAYCWGSNEYGQLGDGSTTLQKDTPVAVATDGVIFRAISAGKYHTCALSETGIAYCWGRYNGDLPVPTVVSSNLVFRSISAGALHTVALTEAGTAYSWGAYDVPQAIVGAPAFSAVSAGGGRTVALALDGTAWRWSQLDPTPRQYPAGYKFKAISASKADLSDSYRSSATAALDFSGNAYYWGEYLLPCSLDTAMSGGSCQTMKSASPKDLGGTYRSISTGWAHSMAMSVSGVAYGWGNNGSGQLGNGSTTDKLSPYAPLVGYSLQSASLLYIEPGKSVTTPVTVTRSGGFTEGGVGYPGTIALSLSGSLPTDITAQVLPSTLSGSQTTATLIVNALGAMTPGEYYIYVLASSSGQPNRSSELTIRVPAPVPPGGMNLVCPTSTPFPYGYHCMSTPDGVQAPGKWNIDKLHTPVGGATWWVERNSEVCVQWDASNGLTRARYSGGSFGGSPTQKDGHWGLLSKKNGDPEPAPGDTNYLYTLALDGQTNFLNYRPTFTSGESPVLNYNFQKGACPW